MSVLTSLRALLARAHIVQCFVVGHDEARMMDPRVAYVRSSFMSEDRVYCKRCGKFLRRHRVMTSSVY